MMQQLSITQFLKALPAKPTDGSIDAATPLPPPPLQPPKVAEGCEGVFWDRDVFWS